jgi:hypothetical protein
MKIRRLTFAVLALLAFRLAEADLVTLVDAVELSPSNIILPGTLNGTVTFKPCAGECDKPHRRARLTQATEFFVQDRKVKYADFQAAMAGIRTAEHAYGLISVDMQSLTITSIRISS